MSGRTGIRKAPENCIREADMEKLRKGQKVFGVVKVFNKNVDREFYKYTDIFGRRWLADSITGTLYDPKTGRCNTLQLKLVEVLGSTA
jgi:hypothetical protein